MLTQSRGAILALGAGVVYFALHTRRKLRTLAIIAALSALAVAATPSGVWNRVAGLSKLSADVSQVDPEGSASGRMTLMHLAWRTALDNRALGIGIGAYSYENARIAHANLSIGRDERGERDAHSTYIRAAAETGFGGGLCILMYVLTSIIFCRNGRQKISWQEGGDRRAIALLALEASMVAYALGAVVNSAETTTYFILQFAIPCALASVILRND
jgi:O-antigen ligase